MLISMVVVFQNGMVFYISYYEYSCILFCFVIVVLVVVMYFILMMIWKAIIGSLVFAVAIAQGEELARREEKYNYRTGRFSAQQWTLPTSATSKVPTPTPTPIATTSRVPAIIFSSSPTVIPTFPVAPTASADTSSPTVIPTFPVAPTASADTQFPILGAVTRRPNRKPKPTPNPTEFPSISPFPPTNLPTFGPPSSIPTNVPSDPPTSIPTNVQSELPSSRPTLVPTRQPSISVPSAVNPPNVPVQSSTLLPILPSSLPSVLPTASSTQNPTPQFTTAASQLNNQQPIIFPTNVPNQEYSYYYEGSTAPINSQPTESLSPIMCGPSTGNHTPPPGPPTPKSSPKPPPKTPPGPSSPKSSPKPPPKDKSPPSPKGKPIPGKKEPPMGPKKRAAEKMYVRFR